MSEATAESGAAGGSLGTLLRAARLQAGLTQAQLADGIATTGYISLIESDQRMPSRDMLDALCHRLGIAPSQLGVAEDAQRAEFHVSAAMVALIGGDTATAVAQATDALEWTTAASAVAYRANAIMCEAALRAQGTPTDVESALRLIDGTPDAPILARARLITATLRTLVNLGDLALGVDCGTRWLREAEQHDWPMDALVELLCMTATCHFYRGDHSHAAALSDRAAALASMLGSPRASTQVHWEQAWMQHTRGEYREATESIFNALRTSEFAEMTESVPRLQAAAAALLLSRPSPDVATARTLAEDAWLRSMAIGDRVCIGHALVLRSLAAVLQGQASVAHALLDELTAMDAMPTTIRLDGLLIRMRAQLVEGSVVPWPQPEVLAALDEIERSAEHNAVARFWAELAEILERAGETAAALACYRRSLSRAHLLSTDVDATSDESQ